MYNVNYFANIFSSSTQVRVLDSSKLNANLSRISAALNRVAIKTQ